MPDIAQKVSNVTVSDRCLAIDKLCPVAVDLGFEVGIHEFTFNDRLKRSIARSE
jgi:hypothetical protein